MSAPSAPVAPSPDPLALRRGRNAVCAAFAIGGITTSAWGPRLPAMIADLRIGTSTMGLVLAASTIGSVCGLFASTALHHWLGSRRAIGVGIAIMALSLALIGLGVHLSLVVLTAGAFIVMGFGIGTLDVMVNVEGAAVELAIGKTVLPLMHGMWSGGAVIGSGIGAACAACDISPFVQFIGEAVVIAVLGAFVVPAVMGAAHVDSGPSHEQSAWQKICQWARGWLDWRLLLIGLVMLGVELGEGSANNWLTLAVHDDHGQAAWLAALFFTVFAVSEASTRLFGGPVVDRLGRVRALRYTTAIGTAGLVLFIFGRNPILVLLGVVFWGIGVSMGFPLGMSAAAESGSDPAARVSVVASVGYLASLGGPPAIGFLAGKIGLLNALWIIVVLFIAGFAAAGVLRPVRAGDNHTE